MFFSKLTRKQESHYHNSKGFFYKSYDQNRAKIVEDCQSKCVYCDIHLDEVGQEGMQLDHFRPQEHFQTLASHPYNLYLSCQKCNRLKSDDWPCPKTIGSPSFVGKMGYIDAFAHDPKNFLTVDKKGVIIAVAGPVEYMIKKMLLNRPARTQIRRKRIQLSSKVKLTNNITVLCEDFYTNMNSMSDTERTQRFGKIIELRALENLLS